MYSNSLTQLGLILKIQHQYVDGLQDLLIDLKDVFSVDAHQLGRRLQFQKGLEVFLTCILLSVYDELAQLSDEFDELLLAARDAAGGEHSNLVDDHSKGVDGVFEVEVVHFLGFLAAEAGRGGQRRELIEADICDFGGLRGRTFHY